jgi:hypothetical protein
VRIFTRASTKRTVSDKSPTRARELPDSAFYEQPKKASGGEAIDRTEEFPYDLHPRVSDRGTARFANVFTRARGALLIRIVSPCTSADRATHPPPGCDGRRTSAIACLEEAKNLAGKSPPPDSDPFSDAEF